MATDIVFALGVLALDRRAAGPHPAPMDQFRHRFPSFPIVSLFALADAGVLSRAALAAALGSPVTASVVPGLVAAVGTLLLHGSLPPRATPGGVPGRRTGDSRP